MEKYLIVGGGLAGLFAGRVLRARGIEFVGLERSERLGGRVEVGHHRIYSKESLGFFQKYFPTVEWEEVQEETRERKKGIWTEPKDEFGDAESFYLQPHFFHPKMVPPDFIRTLSMEVESAFALNKNVVEILSAVKQVVCQDGSQYSYDKIVWCSPLEPLIKLWNGDKGPLLKQLRELKEGCGGVNLELELRGTLFPFKNTMVFPFRYKDNRLHALGVNSAWPPATSERSFVHWLLFLGREITDDREELAKCIRTLKRELLKEFPDLKTAILSEKIVYLPLISGETPAALRSLSLMPDLLYVGPQARLADTDDSLRNMDRTLNNCSRFEETLAER